MPTQPDGQRPRTYVVRPGDTFSGIATSQLGNGRRWPEIWELNRATVPSPDVLRVGQVLVLPPR